MNQQQIEKKYRELCKTPSDISEHLSTLREHYDKCESVTEFGTRACVSLFAALASNAKTVVAYDIADVWVPNVEKLTFHCADVLEVEIEETDALLIDTFHSYKQLRKELELHAGKVRKYIFAHDTTMFGLNGEDGSTPGLRQAILDFLADHPEWEVYHDAEYNNGLTGLKRIL